MSVVHATWLRRFCSQARPFASLLLVIAWPATAADSLFSVAPSASPSAVAVEEPWSPTSILWYCDPQLSGEQWCTLSAFGPEPITIAGAVTAKGQLKVLKGATPGVGPVLIAAPFVMTCTRYAPYVSCRADNAVKLASGIQAAISYAGNSTAINAYSGTPSVLFDWDGDGRVSADKEGLMLMRAVLGFKGTAITNGVPLSVGVTPSMVEAKIAQGVWNGWFSFRGTSTTLNVPTLPDALIFERCARGVRGTALTAGIPQANNTDANTRCVSLMAVE